jgi:hypothetical protein
MKKYVLSFLKRGLPIAVLGPIVLAIIYFSLGASGLTDTLTVNEVCLGIVTTALMAFIAGGITVVYEIERLHTAVAALLHGVVLYLDYLLIYLPNGWLADGLVPFLIFTACFAGGFVVIWLTVYFFVRKKTEAVNKSMSENR